MGRQPMMHKTQKITANAVSPEITPELFALMRPTKEVDPEIIGMAKRARGRPRVAEPKQVVSIRLTRQGVTAWSSFDSIFRAEFLKKFEQAVIAASKKKDSRHGLQFTFKPVRLSRSKVSDKRRPKAFGGQRAS